MSKPIVGVDLDNVLLRSCEAYLDVYNLYTNSNLELKDITHYDVSKVIKPEHKGMCEDLWRNKRLWQNVKPTYGAVEYLKRLDEEYEVYIVTNTHPDTMKWKYEIIKKYFPFMNKDKIITCKNKDLIKLDVLVDDSLENIITCNCHRILIDYPWNRDIQDKEHNIHRVQDMSGTYHVIERINLNKRYKNIIN